MKLLTQSQREQLLAHSPMPLPPWPPMARTTHCARLPVTFNGQQLKRHDILEGAIRVGHWNARPMASRPLPASNERPEMICSTPYICMARNGARLDYDGRQRGLHKTPRGTAGRNAVVFSETAAASAVDYARFGRKWMQRCSRPLVKSQRNDIKTSDLRTPIPMSERGRCGRGAQGGRSGALKRTGRSFCRNPSMWRARGRGNARFVSVSSGLGPARVVPGGHRRSNRDGSSPPAPLRRGTRARRTAREAS